MELEVQHDENARKYFALVDGNEALLSYRESGEGVLDLAHTYVPPALRGRGVADELVRRVLDDLRRRGRKVIPSCWFVRLYIDRHAAYQDLLA
jgi:predicted GNAT family acetyltransferase